MNAIPVIVAVLTAIVLLVVLLPRGGAPRAAYGATAALLGLIPAATAVPVTAWQLMHGFGRIARTGEGGIVAISGVMVSATRTELLGAAGAAALLFASLALAVVGLPRDRATARATAPPVATGRAVLLLVLPLAAAVGLVLLARQTDVAVSVIRLMMTETPEDRARVTAELQAFVPGFTGEPGSIAVLADAIARRILFMMRTGTLLSVLLAATGAASAVLVRPLRTSRGVAWCVVVLLGLLGSGLAWNAVRLHGRMASLRAWSEQARARQEPQAAELRATVVRTATRR
jgi:hypothetical protein